MPRRAQIVSAVGIVAACALTQTTSADPIEILDDGDFANVVSLPNGNVWRLSGRFNKIYRQESTDYGSTWGSSVDLVTSAPGGWNPLPAFDNSGNLHLFKIDASATPQVIKHWNSNSALTSFTAQTDVGSGDFGSNMKAIVIPGGTYAGRILLPYGDSSISPPSGYGNFMTRVRYLSAGSSTWSLSSAQLTSPVPSDWNGASDGACEPTIWVRNNGAVNMLMRSQTGKLRFASSSNGGASWTATADSYDYNSDGTPDINFYTSTGPPAMTRMDNGDLVLLWNNATMPPKYVNSGGGAAKIWYAGRDVLHAAISTDDGLTWKGFREVYLDPYRNQDPVSGDTGTAYPFATAMADGRLLAITGQGNAKTMLRIDTDYLLETDRSDDFTSADPLANWSVFKPYGDVVNTKRSRVQGAVVIDDPDPNRTKNVLHVRRPDAKDPDGAAWNFPMARRGQTAVRLKLQSGFEGGVIALTDRFFNPTDSQGETSAYLKAAITPNASGGTLPGGAQLNAGTWYDLTIDWNTAQNKARLLRDGVQVGTINSTSGIGVWPGLSYLRLRSTASTTDSAGMLIDEVNHDGSNIRDANRTDGASIAGGVSGWTYMKIDDYVPNTLVSGGNPSGNGTTGTFTSPFTGFVNPTTGAGSIGILVESSTGTVRFGDATSTQITSDLVGAEDGETLTIRFVDPADPDTAATVSDVAFRLGSVAAGNVSVKVFDHQGNELPDWVFTTLTSGVNINIGFTGLEDLAGASVIHKIVLSGAGTDDWLVGSFGVTPSSYDLGYKGFQVRSGFPLVPEPSSAAALAAGILCCLRRRRRGTR